MNPLTHFRKIRILPLLSLGAIFALVTAAHAQNLCVSTQTRPSHAILQYTPSANHLSTATAAQVRRATSLRDLRDKWWRYF